MFKILQTKLPSMSFFETVSENEQKQPAILLVDASGSVKEHFANNVLVFEKFENIIQTINNDGFRIIFWNSDCVTVNQFNRGIFLLPHVVKKSALHQAFTIAKSSISNGCLTYPHLSFNAIPKEWISNVDPTHIYFMTDGQITNYSHLKEELKYSIETLFKTYNNIHLHLITVENKIVSLNESESLKTMAGGDVFNIFRDNNLTKHITEFNSFTLNKQDGHKHINNVIPPVGFIPYEQNYFSLTNTELFMEYIYNTIQTNSQNEEYLIRIIQNLTPTIKYLIKEKPNSKSINIIKNFCQMFNNTIIDSTIVEFMFNDTTKQENGSIIYSEYRKKIKEFYKQADLFLSGDTKTAIGCSKLFITLPIDNVIITGGLNNVTESCKIYSKIFQNSSILLNNIKIPVLPFGNYDKLTSIIVS